MGNLDDMDTDDYDVRMHKKSKKEKNKSGRTRGSMGDDYDNSIDYVPGGPLALDLTRESDKTGTFVTANSGNNTSGVVNSGVAPRGARLVLKPVYIPATAKRSTDTELFQFILDALVGYSYSNIDDNQDRLRAFKTIIEGCTMSGYCVVLIFDHFESFL